jgi:hypothetical protein
MVLAEKQVRINEGKVVREVWEVKPHGVKVRYGKLTPDP